MVSDKPDFQAWRQSCTLLQTDGEGQCFLLKGIGFKGFEFWAEGRIGKGQITLNFYAHIRNMKNFFCTQRKAPEVKKGLRRNKERKDSFALSITL
ncbi:hypothetical protein [uncultured Desulfobacter sp.]|uniref:hypothetical protein n=1 Tax=uncultured Desulfobacter sp. TaxID=240139 RepID=UPI002AAA7625|nr:hypothetical protein [uncultured Desulfobacter sp.]